MRAWVATILLSLAALTALGQDAVVGGQVCAEAKAAAMSALPDAGVGTPLPPRGVDDTDALHYELDIEINLAARWVGGSNTMSVRSLVNGLSEFRFRLHENLDISAVAVGAAPVSWTREDEATIAVTLDRPYDANEVFELRVDYGGKPVVNTGYVYISSSRAFMVSQPWFAYLWWPCKDYLPDKTTADLSFTVPADKIVASNGLLQDVTPVGSDRLCYHWRTEYPTADYLYCFGITSYNTFDTVWAYPGGQMPLEFFIFPSSDTPAHRAAWLKTADVLTVFSDLYGLYPFTNEKYGIYQFSNVWFGGMEHQTMTGQNGFGESLTVHELSHQWWGDHVTCATWHDIWLNEGFATYSEALWLEYEPGSFGEPALHAAMAARRPSSVDGSVYCYDISDPNRIFNYDLTYLKAGWVVHMLRHVLGDATFFDFLAQYRAAYAGGSATTEQFQTLAETVSSRDLAWFFDTWVYGTGAPKYRYGWREHVVADTPYLELYVRQTQSFLFPVFTMPIDIDVSTAGGTQTYVVWNDAKREHLLLPIAEPGVLNVEFDPGPWILWTEMSLVPFEEGPPKIVAMVPSPAAVQPAGQVASLAVTFHKDVVVDGSLLTLVGQRHGPVAFAFDYDPASQVATLTPGGPLPSDTYTLTVSEAVVDVAAGLALDGELVKPGTSVLLPTGDGEPGGATEAVFKLTVPGDMNCDGVVGFGDINPYVLAFTDPTGYEAAFPGCPIENADVNEDGEINFADINPFVKLLQGRR